MTEREALEAIAGFGSINLAGEHEHGLRDIIRSMTDCAKECLASRTEPSALIQRAQALLDLDARGALSPHGIGGLAREVIERFIAINRISKCVTDGMVEAAWITLNQIVPLNLIEPGTLRPVLEAALKAAEGHASERAIMFHALRAVEDWWITQGMKHFGGAPYAIFATRDAIAMAEGQQVIHIEPERSQS